MVVRAWKQNSLASVSLESKVVFLDFSTCTPKASMYSGLQCSLPRSQSLKAIGLTDRVRDRSRPVAHSGLGVQVLTSAISLHHRLNGYCPACFLSLDQGFRPVSSFSEELLHESATFLCHDSFYYLNSVVPSGIIQYVIQ